MHCVPEDTVSWYSICWCVESTSGFNILARNNEFWSRGNIRVAARLEFCRRYEEKCMIFKKKRIPNYSMHNVRALLITQR